MRPVFIPLCGILLACSKGDMKPTVQQPTRPDIVAERAADTSGPAREFGIPHIEAHLIFGDGQLSDDIIGPHPWVLWNTIIGEGDAGDRQTGVHHPSEATLVRVVIAGPPNRTLPNAKVQLLVGGLGPSDTLMEATVASFDSTGRQFIPFRLDGTGCEKIQLTARLGTDRVLDSLRAEIPFECGE